MSKLQLIEAIRSHNRSAQDEFLINFDQEVLETYLSRLVNVQGKRGRDSVWVRQGTTPAVATRVH